jgi:uncharacterized membrane protein
MDAPPRPGQEAAIRAHDAKTPFSMAAGPYGHPFHPMLVTVPIGAWVSSLVFDIAARAQSDGSTTLVDGAHWLLLIGVVGALVAAVFGLLDLLGIPRHTKAFRTGVTHLTLNLLIVGLFVVDFAWRHGDDHTSMTKASVGQLSLSIVALVLLGISGWLGGRLSYRFGVRVADEDTQVEAYY